MAQPTFTQILTSINQLGAAHNQLCEMVAKQEARIKKLEEENALINNELSSLLGSDEEETVATLLPGEQYVDTPKR